MQEALQNACKHADASVVRISFSSNHHIHLDITDNGRGMNGEQRDDSYGLQNMNDRAAEIGFELRISSNEGSGTTVSLIEK